MDNFINSKDPFFEVLFSRRSIRRLEQVPVSRETIEKAILAGCYAPSVTNKQPWQFYIVTKKSDIDDIAKRVTEELEKVANMADTAQHSVLASMIRNFDRYTTFFKDAPAIIIVATADYQTELTRFLDSIDYPDKWSVEGLKSTCMAAQNILLALWRIGYGTCIMSSPVQLVEDFIKNKFNIPPNLSIVFLITVGKPVEIPLRAPKRKALNEILHWCD